MEARKPFANLTNETRHAGSNDTKSRQSLSGALKRVSLGGGGGRQSIGGIPASSTAVTSNTSTSAPTAAAAKGNSRQSFGGRQSLGGAVAAAMASAAAGSTFKSSALGRQSLGGNAAAIAFGSSSNSGGSSGYGSRPSLDAGQQFASSVGRRSSVHGPNPSTDTRPNSKEWRKMVQNDLAAFLAQARYQNGFSQQTLSGPTDKEFFSIFEVLRPGVLHVCPCFGCHG